MSFDKSGCFIYKLTNVLTLAESVSLGNSEGSVILGFLEEGQTTCFGEDRAKAEQMLSSLVGMEISSTMVMNIESLQVFQLWLQDE